MSRPFDVHLPLERAYTRKAMFAVEVLDAVTLARLTQGVRVTAKGLTGRPIINHSGLFVWLEEDTTNFETLVIEPGALPYERVEVPGTVIQRKDSPHTIELQPLASYPFSPGVTAIRGSLIESAPPSPRVAIAAATVSLEWLGEDDRTWHGASHRFKTNRSGDFTAFLRLAPPEIPKLDMNRNMTVRLYAMRATGEERHGDFQLLQGRVADATYFWDELEA